ncbi:MAG: nucleotidyltransferase family protein [Hasllibacter sp.]
MIFAAGFGTRMRPLTDRLPKPLIEVGGRTMLDRALDLAAGAGARRVVVNAHYRAEMIVAHLEGRAAEVVVEDTILETGGGLKAALPKLGPGPVLTLNPDGVFAGPNPLSALAGAWARDDGALLLLAPCGRVGRAQGDFAMDGDGRLTRGGDWAYLGAQVLAPHGLDRIDERAFSLNVLWDRLAGEGLLFGLPYEGRWTDVGTPAGIHHAERMLEAGDVRAD